MCDSSPNHIDVIERPFMGCYVPVPAQHVVANRGTTTLGAANVGWLWLGALGMIWVASLLPSRRPRTPERSVEDFGRNMELLAETGGHQSGRWIVTPRKGVAFVGPRARAELRARDRRRRVFVVLLESIGLSFLIGLVPPLRSVWYVTAILLCLLAAYVWLLLWIKQRGPRAATLERTRAGRVPDSPTVSRPQRYVADASSRTPRPAYKGLVIDPDDEVSIVVRPAPNVQVSGS